MPPRLRTLGLTLSLVFAGGCADAQPTESLAARAVAEAKAMPPGRYRDVALREVSRNLRYADRDRAIEAAVAMSEDHELKTFSPQPRPAATPPDDDDRACDRFVAALKPGSATPADDRRIRTCFAMDAPLGFIAPPLPRFALLLAAVDALPPGPTKAELLYMATWAAVPERPADSAREAVRRLRGLLPLLDAATRREATKWLDTGAVDLIEGRPDDAVARVRRAFAAATAGSSLADEPATQAQSMISDLLSARDVARAVSVTDLLLPSRDCAGIDDGLTGVTAFVLPQQDSKVVADYMARLQTSGSLSRLCPNGLGAEIAAAVWLQAGDDAAALAAASRAGAAVIARTRLAIAERRFRWGDVPGARAMAQTIAPSPLDAADPAVAHDRIALIHLWAELGDAGVAERLAAGFPGPGWRGFAYAVIVATIGRARAGPNWGGPFFNLPEVPVDR